MRGRPLPASCSQANVVDTQFGCLESIPFGTNEKIIPYGIGTGPPSASLNMRVSKVIGIGPKVEGGRAAASGGGGGPRRRGRAWCRWGASGNRGGPGRLDSDDFPKITT